MNKAKVLTDLQIRSVVSARCKRKTNKRHDLFRYCMGHFTAGSSTALRFSRCNICLQVVSGR